jgi:hypothetical protein
VTKTRNKNDTSQLLTYKAEASTDTNRAHEMTISPPSLVHRLQKMDAFEFRRYGTTSCSGVNIALAADIDVFRIVHYGHYLSNLRLCGSWSLVIRISCSFMK